VQNDRKRRAEARLGETAGGCVSLDYAALLDDYAARLGKRPHELTEEEVDGYIASRANPYGLEQNLSDIDAETSKRALVTLLHGLRYSRSLSDVNIAAGIVWEDLFKIGDELPSLPAA